MNYAYAALTGGRVGPSGGGYCVLRAHARTDETTSGFRLEGRERIKKVCTDRVFVRVQRRVFANFCAPPQRSGYVPAAISAKTFVCRKTPVYAERILTGEGKPSDSFTFCRRFIVNGSTAETIIRRRRLACRIDYETARLTDDRFVRAAPPLV